MKKKHTPSKEKAREMLHNPPHGKKLTEKQRKFFGYLANAANGLSLYQEGGITTDNNGYYNPDNVGKPVRINSNKITMQGINYPVMGISDRGDTKIMQPNKDYTFKGSSVTELPMMQQGGKINPTGFHIADPKNPNKRVASIFGNEDKNKKITSIGFNFEEPVSNVPKRYTEKDTIITPKGNLVTTAQLEASKAKGLSFSNLQEYANWIEGWASPVESNKAIPTTNTSKIKPPSLGQNYYSRFGNGHYENGGELEELIDFTNYNIAKSGIHIKPENKGKFTAYKKRTGKTTEEALHSKDPRVRKMANFAKNAKKWNHGQDGTEVKENTNKWLPYINAGGDVLQGLSMIKGQNNAVDYAHQMSALTNVQAQSMNTRPEDIKRNYVRPEDVIVQPNQLFPSYGTGSNILSMENGGELQYGGNVKDILNSGQFGDFMNDGGIDALESINPYVGHVYGQMPTAGNKIGGGIGQAAGTFLGGPIGGAVGKFAGNLIGGLIDTSDNKIKKYEDESQENINNILGNYVGMGIQKKNRAFMENGGDVAMNGKLQSYDGDIETISENPYLPDGGETIMFRGASHENGGIPIEYGNSPVEVEGGEPAVKLDDNLVVFGNLKIPNEFIPEIGDPLAKGKKFKNYIHDLSKIESRQNKIVNKSIDETNSLNPVTSFDKLKLTSLQANIMGANMKLKDIAAKKEKAAIIQNAINETAEEFNLDADSLAKGTYKKAKNGTSMKAQKGAEIIPEVGALTKLMYPSRENPTLDGIIPEGANISRKNYAYLEGLYNTAKKQGTGPAVKKFQQEMHKLAPDVAKNILGGYPTTNYGKSYNPDLANIDLKSNVDGIFGERTKQYLAGLDPSAELSRVKNPFHPQQPTFENISPSMEYAKQESWSPKSLEQEGNNKFSWMDVFNQALPYLRPSNKLPLDPNQLMGEMYALSNNELEPVDAQGYSPELSTPYDISLQDILNANQADFNATQKQFINNPAAIATLAGQKYDANSKVLGEQMRINQAEKSRVYEGNRNVLNDAKLKNLDIYDRQYTRQAQAKSNTKAVTQSALNSISSKIAQNKLENKTLQAYENLYNYRYDRSGRAVNMNPLADFQGMIENASSEQLDKIKKDIEKKKSSEKRNGAIVKAIKNL